MPRNSQLPSAMLESCFGQWGQRKSRLDRSRRRALPGMAELDSWLLFPAEAVAQRDELHCDDDDDFDEFEIDFR